MSKCVVTQLEVAYRECVAQLVAEEPSFGINYQDESRLTVDHAISKFFDAARDAETMFIKHRLTAANKNPELVLLQEVEELTHEIRQKDDVLNNCLVQLKQWQHRLNEIKFISEKPIPSSSNQTRK